MGASLWRSWRGSILPWQRLSVDTEPSLTARTYLQTCRQSWRWSSPRRGTSDRGSEMLSLLDRGDSYNYFVVIYLLKTASEFISPRLLNRCFQWLKVCWNGSYCR